MVTHMKTTIEISDALFEAAKRQARRKGTTLRALVEQGLRRVLQDSASESRFRLERRSFGGSGRVSEGEWPETRDAIYKGRGA